MLFKALLCIVLSFPSTFAASASPQAQETKTLRRVAVASIKANIHRLKAGEYVTAGLHQFNSLWTRDFAYRVRGLLLIGKADLVRRQLDLTLSYQRRKDGVLPKGFDNRPLNDRSRYFALRKIFPFLPDYLEIEDPLKPVWKDQNNSMAFDSNLLVVNAALDYLEYTNNREWWDQNEAQLIEVLRYYEGFKVDGMLSQPPFSDWQDTISRPGKVFLTNLQYYHLLDRLRRYPAFGISDIQVADLKQRLIKTFRPDAKKPFRAFAEGEIVNSDSNLLALDFGFVEPASPEGAELYQALKAHPLWKQPGGIPGRVAFPVYPDSWKPDYVKNAGLKDYHDVLYWSWLMALAAKVTYKMGDIAEGQRIFTVLARLAKRDLWIYEIYHNKAGLPIFRGALVDSEGPFTWGAIFMVDMIDYLCSKNLRVCN
jgi:hypothetical protein